MKDVQIGGIIAILFGSLFAFINPLDISNLSASILGIAGWILIALGIYAVLKYV